MQTIRLTEIDLGERIRSTDEKYCVELARSIRDEGLLHPIVLRRGDNRLISGGHRYRAFQILACGEIESEDKTLYEAIPFMHFEEYLVHAGKVKEGESISDGKLRKMEIEENIRRKDMTWWERMFGVVEYHRTCGREARALGDDWTQAMTGELLGLSQAHVSTALTITGLMKSGKHDKMFDLNSLTDAIKYQAELKLRSSVEEQQKRAGEKRKQLLEQAKAKGALVDQTHVATTVLKAATPDGQMVLPDAPQPAYSADFISGMFVDELTECKLLLTSPFDKVTEETYQEVLDSCDWTWAVLWCYITEYQDIFLDLKESTEGWIVLPSAFHWIDNSSGIHSSAMMPNKVNTALVLAKTEGQKLCRQVDRNYVESATPTNALRWITNLLTHEGDVAYDPIGKHHWAVTASTLEKRTGFVRKTQHADSLIDKISSTLKNNIPNTLSGNDKSPFASLYQ